MLAILSTCWKTPHILVCGQVSHPTLNLTPFNKCFALGPGCLSCRKFYGERPLAVKTGDKLTNPRYNRFSQHADFKHVLRCVWEERTCPVLRIKCNKWLLLGCPSAAWIRSVNIDWMKCIFVGGPKFDGNQCVSDLQKNEPLQVGSVAQNSSGRRSTQNCGQDLTYRRSRGHYVITILNRMLQLFNYLFFSFAENPKIESRHLEIVQMTKNEPIKASKAGQARKFWSEKYFIHRASLESAHALWCT